MTTQLIESAGAGIGIMCTYCACTESSACDTPDGPCSWISTDPPVCSALDCQAKHEAKSREDVELANPPIAEREESTTAADLAAGDTEIAELGDPRDDGIQSAAPAARAVSDDRILEIPLDDIARDPKQPRDEGADYELAESIKQNGVLQPIVVRRHPKAGEQIAGINMKHQPYMIVDGERRYNGAKAAHHTTIKARLDESTADDGDRLLHQVLFNDGKRLKPMEEARSWKRIMTAKGWKIQQLAAALGRPKSTVSDRLALLDTPAAFHPLFVDGTLSAAAAPILRQFANVPEVVAKDVIEFVAQGDEWQEAVNAGNAVALHVVKKEFDEAVEDLRFRYPIVPNGSTFTGATFELGGTRYALERAEYRAFEDASRVEERAAQPTKKEKDWRAEQAKADRARRQKAEKERALRTARFQAIAAKLPPALDDQWINLLVALAVKEIQQLDQSIGAKAVGIAVEKNGHAGYAAQEAIIKHVAGVPRADTKLRLLLQLLLATELQVSEWNAGNGTPRLEAAAKLLKLDLKKITVPDPAAVKAKVPGTALAPIKKRKAPARVKAKAPVKKPVAKKATATTKRK